MMQTAGAKGRGEVGTAHVARRGPVHAVRGKVIVRLDMVMVVVVVMMVYQLRPSSVCAGGLGLLMLLLLVRVVEGVVRGVEGEARPVLARLKVKVAVVLQLVVLLRLLLLRRLMKGIMMVVVVGM